MEKSEVILGVDTHLDVHVGAVINDTGRLLGTLSVAADTTGYIKLLPGLSHLGICCVQVSRAPALMEQV